MVVWTITNIEELVGGGIHIEFKYALPDGTILEEQINMGKIPEEFVWKDYISKYIETKISHIETKKQEKATGKVKYSEHIGKKIRSEDSSEVKP